jgi:hypothetical protein
MSVNIGKQANFIYKKRPRLILAMGVYAFLIN